MARLLLGVAVAALAITMHYALRSGSEFRVFTEMAQSFHSQHFWKALEACMRPLNDNTTYVVTGDINAMWIRDSAAQVNPYFSLARQDEGGKSWLRPMLEGVVRRQAQFILTDPYANSFTIDWDSAKDWRLSRGAYVYTGNYEMDSGAYFFWLLKRLKDTFPDTKVLDEKPVHHAAKMMVALYRQEQQHAYNKSEYHYPRAPPMELPHGMGSPVKYTGMVWNAFRPSDDAHVYGYNIPGNLFLASALEPIEQIARKHWKDEDLARSVAVLRSSIVEGVQKHGVTKHKGHNIYCYEVDGFGNCLVMDDANIPSLLSIPYFDPEGVTYSKDIYRATRKVILSHENPWYFEGSVGSGIGSPHTGRDRIWPLSLVMQALTTHDEMEQKTQMAIVMSGDHFKNGLTESFHKDDADDITRPWFGWPNALLGEFLMKDQKYVESLHTMKVDAPRIGSAPDPNFYTVDPTTLRREGVVLPRVEFYSPVAVR